MLKDLKIPVAGQKADTRVNSKEEVDRDYDAACDIINDLFDHLDDCLKKDRSRIKINMLAKGYIMYILKYRQGILDFVKGIYPEDMKLLMNDLEKDILKRKRK